MSALPGIDPARRPYPGGTERHYPLVASVLILSERARSYAPPALIRAATVYDTPTTVRVQLPAADKRPARQQTQAHHQVYAVPDDAAWAEIEAAVATFGARLDDLANLLRRLGSYPKRLAVWKGAKTAPNPLCESVARIEDPDSTGGTHWGLSSWFIPSLDRKPIARHTAKMLTAGGDVPYFFTQEGSFVIADDGDWDELEAAHQAVHQAAAAAKELLARLGTYQDARDGRHAARVAPAATEQEAKALAVVEPAIEGIVVMSREEAEQAEARIIATADDLRRQIDDFDRRRGWMALGHDSFRAWAQKRFPDTSLPTIYRQRDAALVDRDLGVPVGTTLESHARELKHVPSEERPATMQRAEELAQDAGRPRQASDVKQAAQERVANGNTASGLPAPLAAVAEALSRGDTNAAYAAARGVGPAYISRAYAAVDARVEERPLEEALALLAGSAPASVSDAAWQVLIERAARLPGGELTVANGVGVLYLGGVFVTRTNDKLVIGSAISRAEARAPAPPAPAEAPAPASDAAAALDAMVTQARADLVARAAAAGYALTWSADGSARFAQATTGTPFGGARDLGDALKRVEALERQATVEAAPTPAPAAVAEDEPTHRILARAKQALREELAQASPRLKRLLCAAWAYRSDEPVVAAELEDVMADWLASCDDPVLVWAAAETAPATFTDPGPVEQIGIEALDDLTAELIGAEMSASLGQAPNAGDVARWQDALDAHAEALDDGTYQRLAHRIGELRAAAQEVAA